MEIGKVIEACREAGDAARTLRGSNVLHKPDGSPVTEADRRAHEILTARLLPSGFPIMSEEGEIPPHASGNAWVVDPLDGTSSFIKNEPTWAVMVALIENGVPVMGVVYAPDMGALWSAEKGSGAFVDRGNGDSRIRVSSAAATKGASILLSSHHRSTYSLAVAEKLDATVTRMSGLGIKACLIAQGDADLYWSEGQLGEWDVCAPQIIVQEAGGALTDARGGDIRYVSLLERPVAGVAVANELLHQKLTEAGRSVLGE